MPNRFTRFVSNINRGVRRALNRAFGGEQPQPRPPGFDYREPILPPAPPPTPADYAEEEEVEYYGEEEAFEEEPSIPTGGIIGGAPVGEPVIVLYGGEEHFNQPFFNTLEGWMGEATGLSSYELYEQYGLSQYDIIQGLIDEDMDYPGSRLNRKTGQPISGLWEDFRADYDGDTP